jgi:DNA repair exonuclease SbcCD ATPase subunit
MVISMTNSMNVTGKMTTIRRLLLGSIFSIGMAVAGCAGNSDVDLADAEKQAFEDLRSEIRNVIDDVERETKAIEIVDKIAVQFESLRANREERRAQFKKLNTSYDTTRAEFDEFTEESNANIHRNHNQLLEYRQALMSVTTPDEWDPILDVRTKAVEAAFRFYHSI